jgi:hypothetical protein
MPEPITGNAFLDGLLERQPQAAVQPRRGITYNFPTKMYLLPDGRVVELQGDPHNRAYYEDKGYHILSDAPGRNGQKSELRQYTEDELPKILAEQKEKAKIINGIRRAVANDRNVSIDEEGWDLMTVAEMREELQRVRAETGKPIRLIEPRNAPRTREELAEARLLKGMETTEQTSLEDVTRRSEKTQMAGPNPSDGTEYVRSEGYDPLKESRRPRRTDAP